MNAKELEKVQEIIENEGFDYALRFYTDFRKEVKDPQFHKLRLAYIQAADDFAHYVGVE